VDGEADETMVVDASTTATLSRNDEGGTGLVEVSFAGACKHCPCISNVETSIDAEVVEDTCYAGRLLYSRSFV
jgi:Fe-S cluster biogenesis protein NfuA